MSLVEASWRGDGRGTHNLICANVERVDLFGVVVGSIRARTDSVGTDLPCGWAEVGALQ